MYIMWNIYTSIKRSLAELCQILELVPSTKRISAFHGVLTCPFNPLSRLGTLRDPECAFRPGGILLQGWKLTSSQANQCQNADRLMRAATGLMKSRPFCHAAVIYAVRSYHLNAILLYNTLLGQFVKADCLFIFHGYGKPMCPIVFLDQIKCVSGGRGQEGGEPTRLCHESFSHYVPPLVWHLARSPACPPATGLTSADSGGPGRCAYG